MSTLLRARRQAPFLLVALCCSAPLALHARPQAPDQAGAGEQRTVDVRVIEVAGSVAYIQPGEDAGLRVGQDVTIDGRRYRVVAVESEHAVVEVGERRLREGDRGRAQVRVGAAAGSPLEPPVPLSEFEGQWTAAVRPAEQQDPRRVPLGGAGGGSGRFGVTLIAGAAAVQPFIDESERFVHGSLGARVHAEPWQETPFSFDADAALSLWLGEDLEVDRSTGTAAIGARSRPLVRVRELALKYGDAASPILAGLGRLRHAASTVGLLDGVRLAAPRLGNVRVAAFGGVVPDALDGLPALDHRRFGVEAVYHAPRSAWQPFVSVVAHGSMFEGELDERRLSSYMSAFRGPMSMTGYAELSLFDADNPWGAAQAELTAAGVDASVRSGNTRFGMRLDMRTPERSYWLASLLPAGWLCTAVPQPAGTPLPEPCNGFRDTRYAAAADARIDLGRLSLSGGATVISVSSGELIEAVSGFADARVLEIMGRYRAGLGVYATRAAFLDTVAVQASAGGPMLPMLSDALDLSVFYRPALLVYNASVQDVLDHRYGIDMLYTPTPRLDLALTVEGMTGTDVSGVGAFATAVWRLQL
jgi:hypothetical protein